MSEKITPAPDETNGPEGDKDAGAAAPGERYRMPADFFFRYWRLRNDAAEPAPSNSHFVYHVLEGNRRIGTYESEDRAFDALRTEFQKQHPDVPFTEEVALHGKDAQGRT